MKSFLGRPAIELSLDLARQLSCEAVVVSSDSDEIGAFAAARGATYFRRSPETCRDDAPIVSAVLEVLEAGKYDWMDIGTVIVLYPVAPFAHREDIEQGLRVASFHRVVYPVYRAREHIERALIRRGEVVIPRYPEYTEINSQYFEPSYHSAGQWYIADIAWLLAHRTLTPMEAGHVEIPARRAIDIDTPDDWALAEAMYRQDRGVADNGYDERVQTTTSDGDDDRDVVLDQGPVGSDI